jgi:DNA-binding FadR family transcriptional regulator
MIMAGPAADGAAARSRQRLLALIRAGDAEAAASEMGQYLRHLAQMRRPAPGSPAGIAV